MEKKKHVTDYTLEELQYLAKLYKEWVEIPLTYSEIKAEIAKRLSNQKNKEDGSRTETIVT